MPTLSRTGLTATDHSAAGNVFIVVDYTLFGRVVLDSNTAKVAITALATRGATRS